MTQSKLIKGAIAAYRRFLQGLDSLFLNSLEISFEMVDQTPSELCGMTIRLLMTAIRKKNGIAEYGHSLAHVQALLKSPKRALSLMRCSM